MTAPYIESLRELEIDSRGPLIPTEYCLPIFGNMLMCPPADKAPWSHPANSCLPAAVRANPFPSGLHREFAAAKAVGGADELLIGSAGSKAGN